MKRIALILALALSGMAHAGTLAVLPKVWVRLPGGKEP